MVFNSGQLIHKAQTCHYVCHLLLVYFIDIVFKKANLMNVITEELL